MMSTRSQVYVAINGERDYQTLKYGPIQQRPHEVGAWLLLMDYHLSKAQAEWAMSTGDHEALDELRKVLAVGVACAEQHGIPLRE